MKLYKNKVATDKPYNKFITVDVLNIGYKWTNNKIAVSSIVTRLSANTLYELSRRPIEPTETLEQLWGIP